MSYKDVGQDPNNYNNSNSSSNTKYFKFISIFVNNKLDYFKQFKIALEIMPMNINDMTNKINKFVSRNPGNNGNGNGSSSIRCLKFISIFVNNRSSHS